MNKIRVPLFEQGMRGVIGLLRQFKILDANGNGTIEFADLVQALSAVGIDLTDLDTRMVFDKFASVETGSLNYWTFLNELTGELSQFRSDRVELAWRRINPTGAQVVSYTDIRKHFNSSRHPAVRKRVQTEDEVIAEFEQVFLTFHKCVNNLDDTALVSKQEFFDFFMLLSATILADSHFNELLVEVWNIDLKQMTSLPSGKNKDHELTNPRASWKYDFHRSHFGELDHKTFEHNVEEVKRPSTRAQNSSEMPAAGVKVYAGAGRPQTTASNVSCLGGPKVGNEVAKSGNEDLSSFKDILYSRGARGIVGIRRSF